MQSLHPLPHTNPRGPHKEAGANRKDVVRSKPAPSYQHPLASLGGQKDVWDGGDWRTRAGPACLEKGCTEGVMAEGEEDQISAQNFYPRAAQVRKRKRSLGVGMGSKPVPPPPPRHRRASAAGHGVCGVSSWLTQRGAGRGLTTEAEDGRSIPTPPDS